MRSRSASVRVAHGPLLGAAAPASAAGGALGTLGSCDMGVVRVIVVWPPQCAASRAQRAARGTEPRWVRCMGGDGAGAGVCAQAALQRLAAVAERASCPMPGLGNAR